MSEQQSKPKQEPLKITMRCDICRKIWQFENTDCVAEKSIEHHYRSGECREQQRRNYQLSMMASMIQHDYGQKAIWTNPSRGYWNYV